MRHVLPNGTSILIRAIRPDDRERLRAAFDNLDRRSVYTRFFGYKKELTETELEQATNVDFDRVVALVAVIGPEGAETIIGGARYMRNDGPASRLSAELAFTVEEDYQGQGIARYLLGHLVDIARGKGLLHFDADVLATNRPMLAVFARSGLPMRQQHDQDVIRVTLSLAT
jgi:RimJ/RimL family protein N-acetyltransferase